MLFLFVLLTIARWYSGTRTHSNRVTFYKVCAGSGLLLRRLLPLLFLLLSGCVYSQQQTAVYEIIRKNKTIGTMQATRIYEGSSTKYQVVTHVSFWFCTEIDVAMSLNSIYMNGMLSEAWMRKQINGDEKTNNHIFKRKDQYVFTDKEQHVSCEGILITHSISTLYFLEPVNLKEIFSENFLHPIPLQNSGGGKYKIELPDGHVNFYRYEKGICTDVEMETPLSTVFLKLKSVTQHL